MGVPLNVTFLFFSSCFQNYLSLTFDNFIIVCLSVGLSCSIYVGWGPLGLVNLDVHFVLQEWEVSAIIALNILSVPFLFSWDAPNVDIVSFDGIL